MSLQILTIVKKNGDTSYAGSALFNSECVQDNARTINTDNTHFTYAKNKNAVVGDKYEVDEAITTVDNFYAAYSKLFMMMGVHVNVNDSTSDTQTRAIDLNNIVFGVSLPSDTDKSILFIQDGKNVEKILVDKKLAQIEDWATTGTTTTTSTTTTTTTTSTTTTTTL